MSEALDLKTTGQASDAELIAELGRARGRIRAEIAKRVVGQAAVIDQLLVALAGRLVGRLRTADTAARLGGDEFAVLLEDGGDEGMTAADVAGRILETLEEPFDLDGTEVYARACIGISVADPESDRKSVV